MDAMADRWKTIISSTQELRSSRNEIPASQKKQRSLSKNKSTLQQSNDAKESRKIETPKKKKHKNKQKIIQERINSILELFSANQSQKIKSKLKLILEDVWQIASLQRQQHVTEQSSANMGGFTSKMQLKDYNDLEKKYFQCEKQRQYFKAKIQTISKRYEGIQKEVQKYAKIQKLIDNSIQREAEMKKQVTKLKRELQVSQLRQVQQQKIFRKQVLTIHELINSIKSNLPNE